MRILFVCLGNICRSPTAEGVMRSLLAIAGRDDIEVDSAGTAGYHVGDPPDDRSVAYARTRGIDLSLLRGRRVRVSDFREFDLVVAMDHANRDDLLRLAPDAAARSRVRLLRDFDPAAVAAGTTEVPDPYYGGTRGFADVFDVIEAGCIGLLDTVDDERT